jgi:WhiB family redox-sensing transcriptional regulator
MSRSMAERLLFDRMVPQGGDWAAQGLCREVDGDLWFPEQGNGSARQAKEICAQCPVKTECADWALKAREPHGIWGGLSEQERARIRRAS